MANYSTLNQKPVNIFFKKLCLFMALFINVQLLTAQTLIAGWDFQTTANGGTAALGSPNTPTSFVANVGSGTLFLNNTNGASNWTANGELNAFGGTALNAGTGMSTTTTSPACLAVVNSTANGKSIVFQVDMSSYGGLTISYATQRTTTGFNTHTWEYSNDASTWSPLSIQTTIPSAFATITLPAIPTALAGDPTAYVRLTVTGASAAAANNRLDNIQFVASAPVALAPVITNTTLSTTGTVFSSITPYQVTASNTPTSFAATGLPAGLSIDGAGLITGTPQSGTAGMSPYAVTVAATNGNGTGTATLNITINKASQSISFTPTLSSKTVGDPVVALTATSTSGLPVSYLSSNPTVAGLAGNVLSFDAAGSSTITASQAGDADYNAAISVDQVQNVSAAGAVAQSITFSLTSPVVYGSGSLTLNGSASSALPVSYVSSNTLIANPVGSTLNILSVGTVTITASQAGNLSFLPATDVAQVLTITPLGLTITGATASNKTYDGNSSAVVTGATLNGVVGADDVALSPAGALFATSNVGTAISVTTNYSLVNSTAGNYSIVAQPSGLTADITKASQTITFGSIPALSVGGTFTLNATATSGLPITYTSSNTLIATVSGNVVTGIAIGTASITASQAGDANYDPATDVSSTVTIASLPVTYNFGAVLPGIATPTGGLPVSNLSFGAVTPGNNANTTASGLQMNATSASSGYAGVSGIFNAGITAQTGAYNSATSAYFEFTITPAAGFDVNLQGLSFGSRRTGTGPVTLDIRTSHNNFAAPIQSFTPTINSTWTLYTYTNSPIAATSNAPLVIRISGYDGVGTVTGTSAINFRIDDISVMASATPITSSPITFTTNLTDLNNTIITQLPCFGAQANLNVAATGGTAPLTYSIDNGTNYQSSSSFTNVGAGNYTIVVKDALNVTSSSTVTLTQPTALNLASISTTQPLCFGDATGSANYSTAGGTAPYTYQLFNGLTATPVVNPISGLSSGNYVVIATDANGCTATTFLNITQPLALAISTTVNNITCFGQANGSASTTVSGGTAPYSNLWSDGQTSSTASNLSPGTYTLTLTDNNNCIATTTAIVSEPSAISGSVLVTSPILCGGSATGELTASATGGTAPYSYLWNNSIATSVNSNLTAGVYSVTINDANNCSTIVVATLSQPIALNVVSATITGGSTCSASNLNVVANGGAMPLNYMAGSLSNATGVFPNIAAGAYTIVVTDANACTATTTANVVSGTTLSFNTPISTSPSCFGRNNGSITVLATGGTGVVNYASSPALSLSSAGNFTSVSGGTYAITATDAAGCSTATTVVITQPTALTFASNILTSPTCNGLANGTWSSSTMGGSGTISFSLIPNLGMQTTAGNFVGLSSAIYQIKAVDANGCFITRAFALAQPGKLKFASISKTNIDCFGQNSGQITIVASGGVGAKTLSAMPAGTFVSSTSIGSLTAGVYTLTLTDVNGCTVISTSAITQPTMITWNPDVIVPSSAVASNGKVQVSAIGGIGGKTYALSPLYPTLVASGAFNSLPAGVYTATAADSKGCSVTKTIVVTLSTLVVKNGQLPSITGGQMQITPNPTFGASIISVESLVDDYASLSVIDISGKIVLKQNVFLNIGQNSLDIDLSTLADGQYQVVLMSSNNRSNSKVIKQ